jgi:hypothetical protein
MKPILVACCLLWGACCHAQQNPPNLFVITTDGVRWQEIFHGADTLLLSDPEWVQDTAFMKSMYYDTSTTARRRKLMPFLWNVLVNNGALYGNRDYNNRVNVKNFSHISYPGYSEMFTGYADPLLIPNIGIRNRHRNVFDYLAGQEAYRGKVAAFTSWNMFPFIFNENNNSFYLNSGYESLPDSGYRSRFFNTIQDSLHEHPHTRLDRLTYVAAKDYIESKHPKVLYLSLGETDEVAHQGRYDLYLQHLNNVDRMIAELWYLVQTDPFYRDNTTFLLTTDHGRGSKPGKWYRHNALVKGSGDTWLVVAGKGVAPVGECREDTQLYQKQVAATIAYLLGETYTDDHKIAKAVALPTPAGNHAQAVTQLAGKSYQLSK